MANPLNPIPTNTGNGFHQLGISQPRAQMRNDPQGLRGSPVASSLGGDRAGEQYFYLKPILETTLKKRKFSLLADTVAMPKNNGAKLKATVEFPVLDDRNINDQGIDARGVQTRNGNFYGSSRDIGKIQGALPHLTEEGGRVNRFGWSRGTEIEGTINNFGIFMEYTQDLLDFDRDPQLVKRLYKEALETASQITEDNLQADLLNGAGTVIYAGNAVSHATMDESSVITYKTLKALEGALYNNRTPQKTRVITGSQNYDTKTLADKYTIFVPKEVLSILERLKDEFGERAFIPVEKYGAATKVMEDEVGSIANFRVVLVRDMLFWEGAGAQARPEFGLSSTGGRYNIFPALVVGEDSFSCISFQGSNGINNKFVINHQKPSESVGFHDPYGKVGLISLQWWYGILFKRPERIAVIKTVGFRF